MGKKRISFSLSEESIDNAIKQLDEYRNDIQKKTELFRKKVAEKLAEEAKNGFDSAMVDGRPANVTVTVEDREKMSVVIANGEDAVWVEFGAGVYYNGAAGSSPHPRGAELGMIIGDYGKGYGRRRMWGYYDEDGMTLTRGTPATMPMYHAVNTVCNDIAKIAEEVFTDD